MTVPARQFVVLCAVRDALLRASDPASVELAHEIILLIPLLEQQERDFLLRDIPADLQSRRADGYGQLIWGAVVDALECTEDEGIERPFVDVSADLLTHTVRYALGRLTGMPSMVSEEIARLAPLLDPSTRSTLAELIKSHPSVSASAGVDAAAWNSTVATLQAA